MKPKDRIKLYKLIEQWTRCEIMSRLASLPYPEYGNYYFKMIELENEIRKLRFGTDNLAALGERWGILPSDKNRKKKNEKKKKEKSKNRQSHKNNRKSSKHCRGRDHRGYRK